MIESWFLSDVKKKIAQLPVVEEPVDTIVSVGLSVGVGASHRKSLLRWWNDPGRCDGQRCCRCWRLVPNHSPLNSASVV